MQDAVQVTTVLSTEAESREGCARERGKGETLVSCFISTDYQAKGRRLFLFHFNFQLIINQSNVFIVPFAFATW
jgi:hypothetical protein